MSYFLYAAATLLLTVSITAGTLATIGIVQLLCTTGPRCPSLMRSVATMGTISLAAVTALNIII
jgi:hypothetical protein